MRNISKVRSLKLTFLLFKHWQYFRIYDIYLSVIFSSTIQYVSVDSTSFVIYPELEATEVRFSALKRYLCSFYFRIDNETGRIQWNTLYIRIISFRVLNCLHSLYICLYNGLALIFSFQKISSLLLKKCWSMGKWTKLLLYY